MHALNRSSGDAEHGQDAAVEQEGAQRDGGASLEYIFDASIDTRLDASVIRGRAPARWRLTLPRAVAVSCCGDGISAPTTDGDAQAVDRPASAYFLEKHVVRKVICREYSQYGRMSSASREAFGRIKMLAPFVAGPTPHLL